MHDDQFWLLVSLKLSGEATEEELAALEALLQEHPEMGLRLDILYSLWKGQGPAAAPRRGDALGRHLQRLNSQLAAEPTRRRRVLHQLWPEGGLVRKVWTVAGVAAAVIAVFLFSYPMTTPNKKRQIAQNTVSTKPGSQSKIQLPDGTQVWLNADSRITYDESFMGLNRELRLCGEAYFDVAKDKNHPFIIHTSSIDVKVLGTSLNIRSYKNEKNTEAVLIHGSIEITLRSNPDKKIVLEPNEKLVVQNGVGAVVAGAPKADSRGERRPVMVLERAHFQEQDSIATEVLWVKNKLAFDQETLEDVALKIERWYDVKVRINEESLKHTEYSGVFENESLSQVMEALRLTGNFRYSINKNEVIISL